MTHQKELIVISSYPEKGKTHGTKTVGVASYTKQLVHALTRVYKNMRVTVFAEQFEKAPSSFPYYEGRVKVIRSWQRAHTPSIISLFWTLYEKEAQEFIVAFEAYMFGKPYHTFLALICIGLLKMTGEKPYIMMHQVMGDFSDLEKNPLKAFLLNIQKNLLYRLILVCSYKVIVFEEQLKNYLTRQENKVVVIPHIIPEVPVLSKSGARKALGLPQKEKIILYFGYLSPYKGIDWLVNIVKSSKLKVQNKDIRLIVAGGINPNHKDTMFYKKYAQDIHDTAQQAQGKIVVTGFVLEKDISRYFAAADVVVFPYKTFFASSGPLSLAFAHHKPVIISDKLASYAKTDDMKSILQTFKMSIDRFAFRSDVTSFYTKLSWVAKHESQMVAFAKAIQKQRTPEHIAEKVHTVLFGTNI